MFQTIKQIAGYKEAVGVQNVAFIALQPSILNSRHNYVESLAACLYMLTFDSCSASASAFLTSLAFACSGSTAETRFSASELKAVPGLTLLNSRIGTICNACKSWPDLLCAGPA